MSSYVPAVMSSMGQETFDQQIDRILEDALRAFGDSEPRWWVPACNVWDDDDGFYVQMALPGWEASEISLELNQQILTVKGARKEETESTGRYHMQEIPSGSFERRFRLPAFVDCDKASATHKNGLLTISLPKREEARSRRIQIEGH